MSEPDPDLDSETSTPVDAPPAVAGESVGPADPPSGGRYHSAPPPIRLFRSEELFAGDRIVCIEHAGAMYRLQITARGKLILQK